METSKQNTAEMLHISVMEEPAWLNTLNLAVPLRQYQR